MLNGMTSKVCGMFEHSYIIMFFLEQIQEIAVSHLKLNCIWQEMQTFTKFASIIQSLVNMSKLALVAVFTFSFIFWPQESLL